jgi:hypothetical protein
MEMSVMAPNKKWSDLTAREKAPFVVRGIIQFCCWQRRSRTSTVAQRRRSTAAGGCGAL